MSQSDYQVRRATVDDLQGLQALWGAMHFPALDLEKRLTEFQVVATPDGQLLGALGLEILGRHGRLHSEAFNDFAIADALRQRLWDRMQSVATNHGLVRLWTQENAPFWSHSGLLPADADNLKKLPPAWDTLPPGWLSIALRDEAAVEISLDKEFARFKEFEKARTEQALGRARTLKVIATVLALVLAVIVVAISIYVFKNRGLLPGPRPGY
ncbi:MAG: hypothetical protein JWR69_4673 [Pedosphaera sp.]|nr:hypothetical protein [Pedosphaera sp.]